MLLLNYTRYSIHTYVHIQYSTVQHSMPQNVVDGGIEKINGNDEINRAHMNTIKYYTLRLILIVADV